MLLCAVVKTQFLWHEFCECPKDNAELCICVNRVLTFNDWQYGVAPVLGHLHVKSCQHGAQSGLFDTPQHRL